ncbi:MAG: hypothetical protein ABSF97_21765 [Candidatus Sulfotelmatobacter sp.]|jgi:hypothetical protein
MQVRFLPGPLDYTGTKPPRTLVGHQPVAHPKYGAWDRGDGPQFFDEWKLANIPSVPGLYVPFAQTARRKDG